MSSYGESHPCYFLLKSNYPSAEVGSLHQSLGIPFSWNRGKYVKTLNLDTGSNQEIIYEELLELQDERTCLILLPLKASIRLEFYNRRDFKSFIKKSVGEIVYFNENKVTIKNIGPHDSKGWYYLIQTLDEKRAQFYVPVNLLSLSPSYSNNNEVKEFILRNEVNRSDRFDNKNYSNNYYNSHQSNGSSHGFNRAPLTPSPSQSYLNYKESIAFHPLGLSMSSVSQSIPAPVLEQSQRSIQNSRSYMSKPEIDGQFSHLSGGINGSGYYNASNISQIPHQEVQQRQQPPFSRPHVSAPQSKAMYEDITYSTVIKEDNQKRTTRFSPRHPPATELSFTTALNILDDDTFSSMKDFQTVRSGHSRIPSLNSNNNYIQSPNAENGTVHYDEGCANSASIEKARCTVPDLRKSSSLSCIKTQNCEFDTINFRTNRQKWEIGSLVEVHVQAKPLYGVIKWIGQIPPSNLEYAGIELEERLSGAGNGIIDGKKLFDAPEGHGIVVSFSKILKDKRFIDSDEDLNEELVNMNIFNDESSKAEELISSSGDFGFIDCPSVPGSVPPLDIKDFYSIIGRNKGIQGYNNSCYLDSTIFAMFSFASVFDFLLYRPQNQNDIKEYSDLQKVLKEDIVNPLRKNFFVRADKVMKLRKFLDSLSNVQGLTSEEKDPEELLNSLLCQTLKAEPFLHLSSGQTSHTYQLFVERDEDRRTSPTVQELFEQSFFTSDVKLKKIPSILILQMPRFGRQFKVYDKIRPTQKLDITDIIEGVPRLCIICGKIASLECRSCFGKFGTGLDSTAFCRTCHRQIHSHKDRQNHTVRSLILPDKIMSNQHCSTRLHMKLFAVLCIETSHYVTFTRCGESSKALWCLFDSMADRKGEANGYNIPEVSRAYDLEDYLRESKETEELKEPLSPHVRRLLCDGYMYFYQSMEVMMYQ